MPSLVRGILDRLLRNNQHDQKLPVERLKQIQERLAEKEASLLCVDSELKDGIESSSRESAHIGLMRWCGNADKYLRQEIRDPADLGGCNPLFEIDPMSKLPD